MWPILKGVFVGGVFKCDPEKRERERKHFLLAPDCFPILTNACFKS